MIAPFSAVEELDKQNNETKMPTYQRRVAKEIGRKPAHVAERSGAITAYSPVAASGAIGLRSSFLFLFGAAKRKKKKTTTKNNNCQLPTVNCQLA